MWLGRLKIVVAGAIKNLPACNNRHKTAKPLQTRPNLLTGAFKTFFFQRLCFAFIMPTSARAVVASLPVHRSWLARVGHWRLPLRSIVRRSAKKSSASCRRARAHTQANTSTYAHRASYIALRLIDTNDGGPSRL